MSKKQKKTQITGNVGMFYVCYKLSKMGWNVMPTARNTKGIDIIAYNTDMTRMISIQVKTLSTKTSVLLSNKLENMGMHLNPVRSRYHFEYKGFLTFCVFIIKIC